jgi:hypothetical protein
MLWQTGDRGDTRRIMIRDRHIDVVELTAASFTPTRVLLGAGLVDLA